MRDIVTPISFVWFIHLRQFTTVTNECYWLSQTWAYLFEVLQFLISFQEAPWYSYFSLRASYLYNSTGLRFLHIWFITKLAPLWLPLSRVSALYCYYKNMVLRFVRFCLVFDHLDWYFISIYAALTHSDKQQHHFLCDFIRHGWVYHVDTTKKQL